MHPTAPGGRGPGWRWGCGTERPSKDIYLPNGVDPYRTRYGTLATRQAVLIGVMIGLVLVLGLGVAGLFLAEGVASATGPVVGAPLILIVLGFVVVLMALFRRRLR